MNRTKATLIFIIFACMGLLSYALYMQIVLDMLPCPLCVMQRYGFTLIALCCLFALFFPKQDRRILSVGILSGLFGISAAAYHVWVLSRPPSSCGADPLSAPMNELFTAKLLPTLYQVNGLCETPYDPVLGLSIPAWAGLWMIAMSLALIVLVWTKKKERVFFGKIRS